MLLPILRRFGILYFVMSFRYYRTYFLIPLFYIAVIFGLLFLQFSRSSEKFLDSFTGLILTGTMSRGDEGGGGKEIEDLHLRYRGVDFSFGGSHGARLVYRDGAARKLNPVSYGRTETGFDVVFDSDVSLSFIFDSSQVLLTIQADIGAQAAGEVESLIIEFSAVDGAKVNSVERMPILSVDHGQKSYLLSLPDKSSIDMARQLLVVVPERGSALLSFGPPAEDTKENFRQWYANQMNTTTSVEALSRRTTEYLDGVYQGWKTGRFSAGTGRWVDAANRQGFQENLAVAYLAEALSRGDYRSAREQVLQAVSLNPASLSFLSSAFLGNLQEHFSRLQMDDTRESARILSLVQARDAAVWSRQDLVRFAAARGAAGLKDEILKFAQAVNLQTVSFPAALGMLMNYHEALTVDDADAGVLKRFAALMNSKIFPAIIKIKEGFFLENAPGRIDVYLSVLAGRVCIRAGEIDKDPVLESIGRDLIISALNLADRQGFLPKNILVADSALKGTEGRIAAEELYTLIRSDNPYYPRFIDLSPALGPGVWLYTAANLTNLSIQPERYLFRFQFPPGETHHFVLRGAKQYTEIQLRKIPWRIDLNFERYTIGAYYIPQEKLFMAKYEHRSREEEFFMSFVPEEKAGTDAPVSAGGQGSAGE
ncbi:MAG: hypothetical protein LBK13_07330 [Spirochaetales bacterium]|jgi:hypothetical protein|nr:hypothetical protein [Spirochaetales bacterium]